MTELFSKLVQAKLRSGFRPSSVNNRVLSWVWSELFGIIRPTGFSGMALKRHIHEKHKRS